MTETEVVQKAMKVLIDAYPGVGFVILRAENKGDDLHQKYWSNIREKHIVQHVLHNAAKMVGVNSN